MATDRRPRRSWCRAWTGQRRCRPAFSGRRSSRPPRRREIVIGDNGRPTDDIATPAGARVAVVAMSGHGAAGCTAPRLPRADAVRFAALTRR